MKKLIKFFSFFKKNTPIKPHPIEPPSKSKNPYELIYYKQEWSAKRTRKNNDKFWEWEILNNGFKP